MLQKAVSKLFLYTIFLSVIIRCEKLHLPGAKNLNSNSNSGSDDRRSKILNECGRCKVLTDSFGYWLKKTSRGKYEGGDAAWEESKLKSYARSEVRLIEIQEGLCSEVKKYRDYCYILADEAEQVIERWWFHEDPNSVDMYSWLCIETLKYCCPINHFGDSCSPCPTMDGRICNGNGKCDGDGTREGSGACICKKGYTGKHCDNCNENFFSASDGSCEQCHRACNGCSGKGPSACQSCKPGWQLESGVCVDINECLSEMSCKTNEICTNIEGSYKCKPCDTSYKACAGIGAKNCTLCEPFHILWGGMCITREQQNDFLLETVIRLFFYVGITTVAKIIHVRFKQMLYLYFIVIIAVISYLELAHRNTLDIVLNIYQNFGLHNFYDILGNIIKKVRSIF